MNNESAILSLLNSKKTECNFNDNDILILKDFVLNGYSVKEQTDEEYSVFLEDVKKRNEKKGCVSYYPAVYHNLSWTGYISSLRPKDESGNYCPIPLCTGAVISIIWNDLKSNENCKNYYWFDNENRECGQKEFCGAYMYQGLQTFESKTQCEKALNKTKKNWCIERKDKSLCPELYSPVCGCYIMRCEVPPCSEECKTYDNSCFACSNNTGYWVDYWTEGGCENKTCSKDEDCPPLVCIKAPCKQFVCINNECKFEKDICPNESTSENGKCYKTLSNGRKAEIKIMPETASERAIERLGQLNFTVQFKEVGKGDDAKVVYELTGKKQGKFLGIFKIMARVQAQVDAETGNVKVIKPWWSFLASGV